eukprot:3350627-Rhodomonas_salina.1
MIAEACAQNHRQLPARRRKAGRQECLQRPKRDTATSVAGETLWSAADGGSTLPKGNESHENEAENRGNWKGIHFRCFSFVFLLVGMGWALPLLLWDVQDGLRRQGVVGN